MTQTPIFDELVIVVIEQQFEPPCEHFEHQERSHPERHDDGPARYELIMPCGKPFKVCAQFVRWLDAGGTITCTVKGDRHDKTTIVWTTI